MRRATIGTIGAAPPGDLDDLAVFVTVAQHASFVDASRRLGIPKSSVSRAVSRLEQSLGLPLLRRTSRTVVVTDEGRQLLHRAAGHVEGLQEALASLADRHLDPSGVVRVTAPAFTGSTRVAQALAAFGLAYPKISVELDATNAIRDLLNDGFDFGIRVGPHVDADFVARHLWQGRFGLFATHDFIKKALGAKSCVSRAALERAPCVVLRTAVVWRFDDPNGGTVEIAPRARFAVNDPRAAVDVARRGLGIVLAPLEAVPSEARELVRLETDFGEPRPVDLFVVYPTRRLLPLRVRMAIDWLAQWESAEGPRVARGAEVLARLAYTP
jgi:DNA-binding transcriptional LysR family regulator